MIVNSTMIAKSNIKPAALVGKTVKVLSASGDFASMFVGSTGKVTSACGLYKGAVVVNIANWWVSFYPAELEVING